MATKLGLNAVLHRNTGTYGSPTWNTVDRIKDVTLTVEKNLADVSSRASSGWREYAATLKDATVEFMLIVTDTASDIEDFEAFRDAFMNNTSIECAVMDGPIATSGSQGLRATFACSQFTRNETLEEAITYNVQLKPTPADNAPAWYEAP